MLLSVNNKNVLFYLASDIMKSIPHPQFNRDDFSSNIGLFEHELPLGSYRYTCKFYVVFLDIVIKYKSANHIQGAGIQQGHKIIQLFSP